MGMANSRVARDEKEYQGTIDTLIFESSIITFQFRNSVAPIGTVSLIRGTYKMIMPVGEDEYDSLRIPLLHVKATIIDTVDAETLATINGVIRPAVDTNLLVVKEDFPPEFDFIIAPELRDSADSEPEILLGAKTAYRQGFLRVGLKPMSNAEYTAYAKKHLSIPPYIVPGDFTVKLGEKYLSGEFRSR